jgi:hypothetical protein
MCGVCTPGESLEEALGSWGRQNGFRPDERAVVTIKKFGRGATFVAPYRWKGVCGPLGREMNMAEPFECVFSGRRREAKVCWKGVCRKRARVTLWGRVGTRYYWSKYM